MHQAISQDVVLDADVRSARNLVWCLYILHALSLVFSLGLLSLLPLIVNYLKRNETKGNFVYSHHRWQIRSFWWYLFWLVVAAGMSIGFMLMGNFPWVLIGAVVAVLAWIWKAYRLIRGWLDLGDNLAMPM